MKRIYLTGFCLCAFVFVFWPLWAAPPAEAAAGKLAIVTTTTDLASIARSVAGGHATVRSIANGREDPHFLQAKPSFILAARDADLWIRIGMDLEVGWEPPILDGARNPRIMEGQRGHLDASEHVLKLEIPTTQVTRAMGDVHPGGNPHYWLDPLNARIVANSISARLSALAPQHAADFKKNRDLFQAEIDRRMFGDALVKETGGERLWNLQAKGELDDYLKSNKLEGRLGGWLGQLRPYRGKEIITYHKSWIYLTNRYGLSVAAELEPKPGIPPSSSHLARVIDLVKARGIGTLLIENFYSRKAADFVASRTGIDVVVCANSVEGEPGVGDYLALMDRIVERLAASLRKPG